MSGPDGPVSVGLGPALRSGGPPAQAELLVHNLACLYTCDPAAGPLGRQEQCSIAFVDGRVAWIGPAAHAPGADEVIDCAGLIGVPGLVDCHTHAIWAGSRSGEFRRRLAGTPYTQILEEGGGILSTVAATRRASRDDLACLGRLRLEGLRSHGVTTVEVKSGYGLSPDAEEKILDAAWDCQDTVRVVPTFLGAHAIPEAYRSSRLRGAYVRQVIEEQLPRCAELADFVDVYCDRGAFDLDESRAILEAGRALGLSVRAHAEQVSHTGIAAVAAALGATCVDHLERIDSAGIAAMAAHGTVGVLLPGAQLYLRDSAPPVDALREAGVPLAIATDLNPGSSPVHCPWTIATLACITQGFTVEEAFLGLTRTAGQALGRPELGWLGACSVGDLAVFAAPPGEPAGIDGLVQQMGAHRALLVVRDGTVVLRDDAL